MTTLSVAHTPITSKYSYNEDIFPIFRDRCGGCHVSGGPAPMSLLSYHDAYPWAESIREEVMHQRMPPWSAEDGFGSFKDPHSLSAKELDALLEWATGGTPEGDAAKRPAPMAFENRWRLGDPDLVLQMPAEQVLGENEAEATRDVIIPSGQTRERWVRAVDLLPGTPSIVRDARIYLLPRSATRQPTAPLQPSSEGSGADRQPGQLIATWLPGQTPIPAPAGAAFRVPAGSDLLLRIHYKKTWTNEGKQLVDRSAIGLYLATPSGRELRSVAVESRPDGDKQQKTDLKLATTLDRNVEAVALVPERAPTDATVQVEAIRPDGTREPMLRLERGRSDWLRRYWFQEPLALRKGTIIEVTAVFESDGASAVPPAAPTGSSIAGRDIRILIDVVPSTIGSRPLAASLRP